MFGLFRKRQESRTLLGRLRSDIRGNTLAMMAIALIPICALVGSGVDTARLYVVKVRLQQACDAGALAGRKALVSSTSTTLDANAIAQAKSFFANNFASGFMGTPVYTSTTNPYPFTPTKTTDQQVTATATTTVPMTIMKMFGAASVPLTVTCEARFDVADTDVMFVLDTTGSMACTTDDDPCGAPATTYTRPDGSTGYHSVEESGSKIAGLRSAVLNFYDTLAANADSSTHIRYGFVTYTSTVNAGGALPQSAIADNWNYQTRSQPVDDTNGSSSSTDYTGKTAAQCTAYAGRTPTTGYSTTGQATVVTSTYSSSNSTCTVKTQPMKPKWRYQQAAVNTSVFKTGAAVTEPSSVDGTTSKWQGCVEEPVDSSGSGQSTFDSSDLPDDLNPDTKSGWGPMWPEVEYYRGGGATVDYSGNKSLGSGGGGAPDPGFVYGDYSVTSAGASAKTAYTNSALGIQNISFGYYSCGKPVSRLKVMSRSDVNAYVTASDFTPIGGTYHDAGMIWGTRMISPTGLFASDTAAWSGRNSPNRYIIFMTDGPMSPNASIYGMWGMENYDKRVTGTKGTSNDEDYHNARFLAVCQAAKDRGIKVFVISFGLALTDELKTCAYNDKSSFYASDNAKLDEAFQSIAKQVALLRISQ